MSEVAEHRLLLLLSDGKPNDSDDYEGRYGVEDMRQAVNEAKLQGIFPFCLTIDRQAANYLPSVFEPLYLLPLTNLWHSGPKRCGCCKVLESPQMCRNLRVLSRMSRNQTVNL